jgi:YD repeat-containing protein
MTNAAGHVIQYTKYDKHGQVLESLDPNGVVTTLSYDIRQRLSSRTVAVGTSAARTTNYSYWPNGLLRNVDLPASTVTTVAGAGGNTARRSFSYGYDTAHRLTNITTATGEKLAYTLDKAGNITREEIVNGSAVGGGTASVLKHEFDALGRLYRTIKLINGAEQLTLQGYDANGNPTTHYSPPVLAYGDPYGYMIETRRYNALNQLTKIEDVLNGAAKPTVLAPDPRDLLTSVKAPNNATTNYTYDGFGQTLAEAAADVGGSNYSYDAAGNLSSTVDARGTTQTWTYDALNRATSVKYSKPGNSDNSEDRSFIWDSNPGGAIACSNGVGRLCKETDATGARHYAYDPFGNVTQVVTVEGAPQGNITSTQQYGYDVPTKC